MKADKPLFVTQPTLPELRDFIPYLEQIWESRILTNVGPFHQRFEEELRRYLGVPQVSLLTNGTLALIAALRALEINGEVITTPFSFVATAHSLLWIGIRPVFVDIDPVTLNLDPGRIEAAITPRTTAIVPAHCYGHPCDVERIGAIAERHGLKVVYDAAHAFGVRDARGSVLNRGNLSVLSFHATKTFNTFEGGAIVCHDEATKRRIDQLRNFGFVDEITVSSLGFNAKMSEINAAFGVLQLGGIDAAREKRANIDAYYRERLAGVDGIHCHPGAGEQVANYAFFPILVGPEYPLGRDGLYSRLRAHNIHVRRYFYPLISDLPMYRDLPSAAPANLPAARAAASRVLCLPMSSNLSTRDAARVVNCIRSGAVDA